MKNIYRFTISGAALVILLGASIRPVVAKGGSYSTRVKNSCFDKNGSATLQDEVSSSTEDVVSAIKLVSAPSPTMIPLSFNFHIDDENGNLARDSNKSPLQGKFNNVITSFSASINCKHISFENGDLYTTLFSTKKIIRYRISSKDNTTHLILVVPIDRRTTNRNCSIKSKPDQLNAINDASHIDSAQLILCATKAKIIFSGEQLNIIPPVSRIELE